jgi:hypothetical protein
VICAAHLRRFRRPAGVDKHEQLPVLPHAATDAPRTPAPSMSRASVAAMQVFAGGVLLHTNQCLLLLQVAGVFLLLQLLLTLWSARQK